VAELTPGSQDMPDSGHDPFIAVGGESHAHGHLVRGQKADPVEVVRQPIGVAPDGFDRSVPVELVDAHGKQGGYAVGLQKHHHVANGPVLRPCIAYGPELFFGYSGNFCQFTDVVFEDVQGVFFEVADDFLRGFGSYAANQP